MAEEDDLLAIINIQLVLIMNLHVQHTKKSIIYRKALQPARCTV